MKKKKIKVIDLFCGIWGLSHWLLRAGFPITAGFDIDWSCKFWYEFNNEAKFYEQDIKSLKPKQLNILFKDADIKILVGCAPCQPYSMMNTKKGIYTETEITEKSPLDSFAKLIKVVKPDIVSMENVPGLVSSKKSNAFERFYETLKSNWYNIDHKIINCTEYGIPQTRKRLVLLASKLGDIKIIPPTHKIAKTVRETIADLPKLNSWETCKTDRYHIWQNLTEKNIQRLKAIPHNWWDLLDVDQKYRPSCYKKKSWKSYLRNVYWRMFWDKPAPTMTTLCTWLWNGRFGHPEQNRAISVREAARIQTFPDTYEFFPAWEPCNVQKASRFIGNAVPVRLGEIIGESILNHLNP